MTAKRVVIAADHLGLPLKDEVRAHLEGQGVEVVDMGVNATAPVDYPDLGRALAERMADDTVEGAELALALGPTLDTMLADGRLVPDDLPLTRAILDCIRADAPFAPDWARFHHRHAEDS